MGAEELGAFRDQKGGRLLERVSERHLSLFCTDFGVSTGSGVCEEMLEMISRKSAEPEC